MIASMLRRGLLLLALTAGLAAPAIAQTDTPAPPLQGFSTAEAAADALTDAMRRDDDKAMAAILGQSWWGLVPTTAEDQDRRRNRFVQAWDANHKVTVSGDTAKVEVGTTGWIMPIPIVKSGDQWRFDIAAGRKEMQARRIGHDELATIQTLLAIVDAQRDYAALDPMKTGVPQYARQFKSSPGKKDGLYWETAPGEPESPLGPLVAQAQAQREAKGVKPGEGYNGYHFRLLFGQGSAAHYGAQDYIIKGRLIGGFGVIATPVTYGETGVSTFIVNQRGEVFDQDLGPDTTQRAAEIKLFDPDKNWQKADTTPP